MCALGEKVVSKEPTARNGRFISRTYTLVSDLSRRLQLYRYTEPFAAEMALATLVGTRVPGVEPPWFLNLWATPALTPSMPKKPLLPLFFFLKREWLISHSLDAQTVFQWFRRAGPVLAVHLNVDIGYEQPACLVEYYLPEHQQAARKAGISIHRDVVDAVRPPFRVIDPWNLYCVVRRTSDLYCAPTLTCSLVKNLGPDVDTWEFFSEFRKVVFRRYHSIATIEC